MSCKALADLDLCPKTGLTYNTEQVGFFIWHSARQSVGFADADRGITVLLSLYNNHHTQFTMYWEISPFIVKEGKRNCKALWFKQTENFLWKNSLRLLFFFFFSIWNPMTITTPCENWSSYISLFTMWGDLFLKWDHVVSIADSWLHRGACHKFSFLLVLT